MTAQQENEDNMGGVPGRTLGDNGSTLLEEAAEGREPGAGANHDDGRGRIARQPETAVAHKHWHARARRLLLQEVRGNALVHAPCPPPFSLFQSTQSQAPASRTLCMAR